MNIKDVAVEVVAGVVFFATAAAVVALIFMYGW